MYYCISSCIIMIISVHCIFRLPHKCIIKNNENFVKWESFRLYYQECLTKGEWCNPYNKFLRNIWMNKFMNTFFNSSHENIGCIHWRLSNYWVFGVKLLILGVLYLEWKKDIFYCHAMHSSLTAIFGCIRKDYFFFGISWKWP